MIVWPYILNTMNLSTENQVQNTVQRLNVCKTMYISTIPQANQCLPVFQFLQFIFSNVVFLLQDQVQSFAFLQLP